MLKQIIIFLYPVFVMNVLSVAPTSEFSEGGGGEDIFRERKGGGNSQTPFSFSSCHSCELKG